MMFGPMWSSPNTWSLDVSMITQQDGLLSSMAFLGRPGNSFMCSQIMTENIGKKREKTAQRAGLSMKMMGLRPLHIT
jgi:hypothetical protein